MTSLNHYNYTRCHGGKSGNRTVELYKFKNDFNDVYIVEIFHYDHNVYAIKFFLKKHRLSQNRYSLSYPLQFKTKRGYPTGNKNFIKVLNTVVMIALDIAVKDSLASFGFMGAPKPSENDPKINGQNINSDNTVANTKRYKVYNLYAKRYFSPEKFEYIDSKTASILLLKNTKNINLTKEVAEEYIINEIIPNL